MSEINHERLFQELEYFKEKEVQEINVLDPIFNLKPKHYLEICRRIDTLGMQSRFYFQCRLELLCRKDGEEFLQFCRNHDVWLEFGVQTLEKRKVMSLNAAINMIKSIRRLTLCIKSMFPSIFILFSDCRFSHYSKIRKYVHISMNNKPYTIAAGEAGNA